MTDIDSLKYEGLAALIITGHENAKERHLALEKHMDLRFTGIEEHNKKQNGTIAEAVKEIAELKKESDERKLTCMMAVRTLQERSKYTKLLWWIDKHPKTSVAIILFALFFSQFIVHLAVLNGWVGRVIDLMKGI